MQKGNDVKTQRGVGLIAVAALFSVVLAGCSATPSSTPNGDVEVKDEGLVVEGELIADTDLLETAREQSLTVYTGFQESNQIAIDEAFTADTGITVDFVRDVPNKLSERILSEFGAKQLGADVVITSDYEIAHGFTEAGVWEPYRALPVKDDETMFVDDASFTRASLVVVTFAYNTQLVDEADAPKSWKDLLDPKWAGSIGVTTGVAGGSSVALNRFVTQEVDENYWQELAELKPTVFDSGGARQTALARGELKVATAGTAAVNLAVSGDNAPIQWVLPEEGLVLFNFFAGITSTSQNTEAAQVYMNWLMSKRGQEVIAETGNYSVRTDVATPVATDRELPSLDSDQVWIMKPEDETKFGQSDAKVWLDAFDR